MQSRVLLALSCSGLIFCHTLSAATLKFGNDVELLAIDGQPLPAALFQSANSLELDAGVHQMLFRVSAPPSGDHPHYSAPLIAVFDTRDATSVTIKLPKIDNGQDLRRLEQTLNFELLNHRGNPVEYRADVLSPPRDHEGNYRQQLQRYNHSGAGAALPELAR